MKSDQVSEYIVSFNVIYIFHTPGAPSIEILSHIITDGWRKNKLF